MAFPCQHCPSVFTLKRNLNRHNANFHSGNPRVYPCYICGEVFYTYEDMRAHRSVHKEKTRFEMRQHAMRGSCKVYEKKFTWVHLTFRNPLIPCQITRGLNRKYNFYSAQFWILKNPLIVFFSKICKIPFIFQWANCGHRRTEGKRDAWDQPPSVLPEIDNLPSSSQPPSDGPVHEEPHRRRRPWPHRVPDPSLFRKNLLWWDPKGPLGQLVWPFWRKDSRHVWKGFKLDFKWVSQSCSWSRKVQKSFWRLLWKFCRTNNSFNDHQQCWRFRIENQDD